MADALAVRQADLDKILEEADALQKKNEGKKWDPKERERFEGLCKEGEEMQKDIAAEQDYQRMQERGRELKHVPEPTLPSARNQAKNANAEHEIAGYISLGDAVIASEAFRKFAADGYARGHVAVVQLAAAVTGKNVRMGPQGEPLVPLTRGTRKMFEDFLQTKEAKAVPTLGTGVLDVDRVARVPQVTADTRLRIRDVISTGQTSAGSVEYVREEPVSGTAEPAAHGVEKAELGLEYTLQQVPVRTIAGWMPVQNQQLEDWSQLRSLIDNRLRYQVARSEEREIIFGSGTPPHIEGIMEVAGTTDIALDGRYQSGTDTLIDVVRRGVTDVFVAGYEPNAVVLHPFDWETITLEKGNDDRYVWAVVTNDNGSRIWGIRVVESVGCQSRAPADFNRRELIVGDWLMGCQLLDRMDLTVQVGLIDRQFVENMRTILAEERIALPIYAPAAFAHFTTEAGS
jgi:HK97 family phage major capsid protein